VKEHLLHWARTLLSGVLTILIANCAVAAERKPGTANHILCLHPNASLDRPGKKAADAMILACLLSASSPEKTVSWQREFRRCLSDRGVILAADCHY
jgi:hypothetical protein